MTSSEIRESFLSFFESKKHRIVQSAPVIPHGDPTLLFTNAGMNQFKDVFLGRGKRDYTRAADTQKCIRVSGKHNDLEEVGIDTYHHTFFEMLGNWSFGDYYKEEAIGWAWELLTKIWKLQKERLYVTVFRDDDEAFKIWTKYLPEKKIFRFDEKDNFWEMGETGPCGPCSEVHYDRTSDLTGYKYVNKGSADVVEIWNLVFIQYNRNSDGTLEELSAKHIDTGMGFERVCAVIQNKNSNYDTDIFQPLINEIEKLSGEKYTGELKNPVSVAMRVIADHLRALSFAIADGALPGNEGRGYVLRRLLRRGVRYARNIGFREPVIYKLVPVLVHSMGTIFPELRANNETIEKVIKGEEESFLQVLDRGLSKFEDIIIKVRKAHKTSISGSDAFQLYDSFGFPFDLTELMVQEAGLGVDVVSFNKLMEEQKERSRASRKTIVNEYELPDIKFKSVFTGYEESETEARLLYANDNLAVFDKTPFYVESGGQISDTGKIVIAGETYLVNDVRKSGDAIVHICDKQVEPLLGEIALLQVDSKRRRNIMRNHSATHLLHQALYETLGSHIKQAGSLVAPDYLRFDFNHFDKLSREELLKIENIVNERIFEGIPVETEIANLREAQKNPKIKMFFGDKYGDTVRVVIMSRKFSMELCGGTHVSNTSEIGIFKITSESSIAAGVRRIEAITGKAVQDYIYNLLIKLDEKENINSELLAQLRSLEKQLSIMKVEGISNGLEHMIKYAIDVSGIRVIRKQVEIESLEQMRLVAENLRDTLGKQGIGLLVSATNGKVQIVCTVTDDIKDKIPAGKLVSEAAKILGGGGGGKAHMATAGGKDVSKIPELLNVFPDMVRNMLEHHNVA